MLDRGGYYPETEAVAGPAELRAARIIAELNKEATLERRRKQQRQKQQRQQEEEWADCDDPALYEWPYLHSDELMAEFPLA